jgi:hypothetical protein
LITSMGNTDRGRDREALCRVTAGAGSVIGGLAGVSGDAELAEGMGEVAAQPLIVLAEFPVAGVGGFEPAQQGCVGAALAARHRRLGGAPAKAAEPFDLGPDVGLGVEPRPGHPGCLGDDLEGHGGARVIEFAKRPDDQLWRADRTPSYGAVVTDHMGRLGDGRYLLPASTMKCPPVLAVVGRAGSGGMTDTDRDHG